MYRNKITRTRKLAYMVVTDFKHVLNIPLKSAAWHSAHKLLLQSGQCLLAWRLLKRLSSITVVGIKCPMRCVANEQL
jgi:hypothetical protein